MKRAPILILLVLLFVNLSWISGQNRLDYNAIKDSVFTLSCGAIQPEEVKATLKRLLDLDTTQIESGLPAYCYDMGMTLQVTGMIQQKHRDTLLLAIAWFKKAAGMDPSVTGDAYHFITWTYLMLKDCMGAEASMKVYNQSVRKRKRDKDLIQFYKRLCKP